MIKVLVAEDSRVARELLVHIITSEGSMEVVGVVGNGEEAVTAASQMRPDVITMDINMPKMDGFQATKRIMESHPTPIVIVTASWDATEVAATFRAVEAGALAILARPLGLGHPDHLTSAKQLVETVKLMSEVKVVRRWARGQELLPDAPLANGEMPAPMPEMQVVAIGASTGGPLAIQKILTGLPAVFPAPILVVQHIAAGFVDGFVQWLSQSTALPVQLAKESDPLKPGHVYVAPDGRHLGVTPSHRIAFSAAPPINGMCPAVAHLFQSVAHVYRGHAAAVLLTGMGKDGAAELKLLREAGALTIIQDEASSVVFGMPGEALRLGAAAYVDTPEGIAALLRRAASGGDNLTNPGHASQQKGGPYA